MKEKQRQEIEESIEMKALKKRLEEINKLLVGKNIRFELRKSKEGSFNYEIKTTNKSGLVIATRCIIGKIETLEYICGLEKGLQLLI